MSRVMSFRDLKIIPELSKYNEVQLLHPSMDETMAKYLGQLGFDLDYAIQYIPANHRDMQGKTGIGFRAVGEISINRAWVTSSLCDATERMIAAFHTDPGLARELAALMGNSISFKDEHDEAFEDNYDGDIEADYEEKSDEIKSLIAIRDQIRGNPYDESGSLKLLGRN